MAIQKKEGRRLAAFLEANGFTYVGKNGKGFERYTHARAADVGVGHSIQDHQVKQLISKIQKELGIETAKDRKKRDSAAISERQSAARDQARAEHDRLTSERDEIMARLDGNESRQFAGLIVNGTPDEIRALRRRLIEIDDERIFYQSLMTDVPTPNAHSGRGRAEHRS